MPAALKILARGPNAPAAVRVSLEGIPVIVSRLSGNAVFATQSPALTPQVIIRDRSTFLGQTHDTGKLDRH